MSGPLYEFRQALVEGTTSIKLEIQVTGLPAELTLAGATVTWAIKDADTGVYRQTVAAGIVVQPDVLQYQPVSGDVAAATPGQVTRLWVQATITLASSAGVVRPRPVLLRILPAI